MISFVVTSCRAFAPPSMPTTTAAVQPGQPPQRAADGLCIHRDYIAVPDIDFSPCSLRRRRKFRGHVHPTENPLPAHHEHRRGIRRFDWYTGYYTAGVSPSDSPCAGRNDEGTSCRRGRSRLYPISRAYSKQLMYVYDKPMIYYPLSLMLGGLRHLIITTPEDQPTFRNLLGNGERLGMTLSWAVQGGRTARAGVHHRRVHRRRPVCLILGDNLFYGHFNSSAGRVRLRRRLPDFRLSVKDPERYVVEYDSHDRGQHRRNRPGPLNQVPGCTVDNTVVGNVCVTTFMARRAGITNQPCYLAEGA